MKSDTTQGWERLKDGDRHRKKVVAGAAALAIVIGVAVLVMHREPPRRAVAGFPASVASHSDVSERPEAIRSYGVAGPRVRVEITPEVAGKVVYVHSQLRAGGMIRANEKIVQVDPGRYELAVRKARAVVDEALAKLDLERAAAGLRSSRDQDGDIEVQIALPAALQNPLVRQAEAALESAKADLAMAELELSRTSVVLPVDILIVDETASLGQYVDAGRPVATAYGTEAFVIEAPVAREDLDRLGISEGDDGSEPARTTAEVRAVVAGREHVWSGKIVGTTKRVNPSSGMTSILVEVPQPMAVSGDRPALLPGMAVEVFLGGDRKVDALQADKGG
ncbi:MAG: efflux RND transporter periplasmic adaptor subunit [Solirubrobacterales bacterium]